MATPSTSRARELTPPRSEKRARPSTAESKHKQPASDGLVIPANTLPVKDVRCNIHGTIKLEPLLVAVMDSPVVQRLKHLRQLGVSEHVYPTATHSRFEHSLGVMHLAGELCRKLAAQSKMPATVDRPDDKDILCVKLAGLLHDIGHGPFSHAFEGIVKEFKHEEMSTRLLRNLLKGDLCLSKFGLNPVVDVKFIEELIDGTPPDERQGRGRSKWYLYDIISNKASGLDVDRIDYLFRDNRCATGKDPSFSWNRIVDNAAVRIKKSEEHGDYPVMAFARKSAREIWKVFQSRYEMFDKVYLHTTCIGRELLLSDLLRAFQKLPAPACFVIAGKTLEEAAAEPSSFIKLNDQIITRFIQRIEDLDEKAESEATPAEEKEKIVFAKPQLDRAKQLLELYLRHSHYTKLVEKPLPKACTDLFRECGTSSEKLVALQTMLGLDEARFKVFLRTVHHGEGAENPMRNMCFFDPKREPLDPSTGAPNEPALPLTEEEWDTVPIPRRFAMTTVCVFFRGDEGSDRATRNKAINDARDEVMGRWNERFNSQGSNVEDMQSSQGMS